MKYTSQFHDINTNLYTIDIVTHGDESQTQWFKLGGTPFVTTMKADGKNIYAPIKTSGATVTMLINEHNFDLYTGQAQDTKVTLKDNNNNVIWCGYLTPCMYDMGFDDYFEEVEIEAVDGLAMLKDIPFETVSKDVETFSRIIYKILKRIGFVKNFYITDNVQLKANGNESIIEKLRISQANFFDEKKDINQSDSDVAWSCYDVLKQMMQFLGYTMFMDGEDVYAIDYDAIMNGNNRYFRYRFTNMTDLTWEGPTHVTKQYSRHIDGEDYSRNGTNVSLDKVYNKVTVKDDFYTFESPFPKFGDIKLETNITATNDVIDPSLDYYYENSIIERTDVNGKPNNFQIFVSTSWKNRNWVVINKFYESPVFDFLRYDTTTRHAPVTLTKNKWSDMLTYNGAFYCRQYKKEIDGDKYDPWHWKHKDKWQTYTNEERYRAWVELLNTAPEKISLSPLVTVVRQNENRIGPTALNHTGSYDWVDGYTTKEDCQYYPVIKLKGDNDSAAIFGGEGSYLIIKGTFRHHEEEKTPYPLADGGDNDDLKREGDYKYSEEGFIWARLKWGDSWWDGEAWQAKEMDFKLRFWEKDRETKPDCQNKTIYDKDFDFVDNAMSEYGCDDKGVYVPAPTTGNLNGVAEFTLYLNRDMRGDSRRSHWHDADKYSRYYSNVVILKNLQIKACISNGLTNDDSRDSDTVYTNVIDNGSVNKMGEIKFKVCTFDNKKPTYSSVDYLENGKSVYLTKTVNKANNARESGSISSFDNKAGLTQEEHLIFKLVNQYKEPKVKFTATLHNDGHKLYGIYTDKTITSRRFIIDEMEVDVKANTAQLKLIEKW